MEAVGSLTAAGIQAVLDHIPDADEAVITRCAHYVHDLTVRAEKFLVKHNIPEGDRPGTRVAFRPAGPDAKSGQHSAVSTSIALSRTKAGWFLTGMERCVVEAGNTEYFLVLFSNRAATSQLAKFGMRKGNALKR